MSATPDYFALMCAVVRARHGTPIADSEEYQNESSDVPQSTSNTSEVVHKPIILFEQSLAQQSPASGSANNCAGQNRHRQEHKKRDTPVPKLIPTTVGNEYSIYPRDEGDQEQDFFEASDDAIFGDHDG